MSSTYSWTMLSAAEWTLNSGMPNISAASAERLKLSPITPLRTSFMRGLMRSSATLIGTPHWLKMSVCIHMTSGKMLRDLPRGWCATTASIRSPFSRRRSAMRISAGVMSIPHRIRSASVSLAISSPQLKRQSE